MKKHIPHKTLYRALVEKFKSYSIPENTWFSWAKNGHEVTLTQPIGNKYVCSESDAIKWEQRKKSNLVKLDRATYERCIRFAFQMALNNTKSTAQYNTNSRRGKEEVITDCLLGILGEEALSRKALEYGVGIKVNNVVEDGIPSDDITQITTDIKKPKSRQVWMNPSKNVSVKSTKMSNCLLAVPQSQVDNNNRKSDLFALIRVDLPFDWMFELYQSHPIVSDLFDKDSLVHVDEVTCELVGWTRKFKKSDLYSQDDIKSVFGLTFQDSNYIKRSGDLNTDWKLFFTLITKK